MTALTEALGLSTTLHTSAFSMEISQHGQGFLQLCIQATLCDYGPVHLPTEKGMLGLVEACRKLRVKGLG